MENFLPFFLIIFVGVFFSMIFRRIHVPWVVGLIIGGILVGPHVLGLLTITPTAEFIGQIGLVFLMFMAGLETNISSFKGFRTGLLGLSFINGVIPFIVGVGITLLFGYGPLAALLVGIIFISSSIAVVIPSLERHNLLHTRLGQSVVMTSVIQDIASLVLLSVVLQNIAPVTKIPLFLFYPLLLGILILFRILLPRIIAFLTLAVRGTQDLFQQEFRATFLILIGTVITFELLGLHPIIAGFFVGFILSDSMKSTVLKEKIRTVSYGVFIPTFFILVGAGVDMSVFLNFTETSLLVLAIVAGSIIAKFASGWLGGKLVGFPSDQALLFGTSSIPQLSTTLAVAFSALSLGLLDDKLIAAMVALSIVTVVVSPTLMNLLEDRISRSISGHGQKNDEQ